MKINAVNFRGENILALCQRALCLLLIFTMMGNLSAEAAGLSNFLSANIRQQVVDRVEQLEQTQPAKTPQQFLKDLLAEIEKSFEDQTPAPAEPQKQTEKEYAATYAQEVDRLYKEQIKKFDKEAKTALADFDRSAQEAYDEQVAALGEVTDTAQEQLASYRALIQEEKEKYAAELAEQKNQFLADLNKEKAGFMADMPKYYGQYIKEFDEAMAQAAQAQLEFYRDLISQIVTNYKKTTDQESKENFVSLITLLSSFKQKDRIFTGEDKKFIQETLQKNFLTGKVCSGHAETAYKPNATWGSSAMGGSPSAGRMFDNTSNRTQTYKLNNEPACNLAISSLIPFANLNGNGLAIAHFLKSNLDDPMFGQMLLVGAKALTITRTKGMEGLSMVVDAAIQAENGPAATAWKKAWQYMDYATGDGLTRNLLFDGKFMSHNVSASARRNPGEPNVWEDVALLLAQKNTPQATAILQKAVDQCQIKVSGAYPNEKQFLECKGIYPFLFGVLTQKPELAEHLKTQLRANEIPGKEFTRNGSVRELSVSEAAQRKKYNDMNDLARKYTKGELLGTYFYHQFFEDLYPADKQRMDSLIANTALLNPRQKMRAYAASESDETYNKLVRKFNAKTVIVALGGSADILIMMLLVRDLGLMALRVGAFAKNVSNAVKIRKVILEYKHLPLSVNKSLKIAHGLQARGIGVAQLQTHQAFLAKMGKVKNTIHKIPQLRSKIIVRLSEGRVPPKPQVEPLRKTPRVHHLRKTATTGQRVKFNADIPAYQPAKAAFVGGAAAPLSGWQQVKMAFGNAWRWMNPKVKAETSKSATTFKLDGLTMTYQERKAAGLKEITSLVADNGTLYINGQMAKTYKAYLSLDQLAPLSALAKEEKVALGFDGMWVKLVDNTSKTSRWDKIRALNEVIETVPLYDGAGLQMMHVGLNSGYKAQRMLLGSIKNGASLVFKNGKIYLQEGGALKALNQFSAISLPKTAMSNMLKGNHTNFLQRLFTLPDKGNGGLRLVQTRSKIGWPFMINILSYSASASALMLTLEQEFDWTPASSMAVGMVLPYLTSPLAPFLSPVVKRFGARRVMTGSLWLASASLGASMLSGWRGHGQDKDVDGKMKGSFGVLLANAFLTGLSSTGIRASSNVMIKAYETSAKTTVLSMAFKSVGALSMTLIPAGQHLFNKTAGLGSEKDWDFSGSYWFILPLSVITALGLRFTMPNMARPGYVLKKSEFLAPVKFLGKKEVWPYVGGITLMSALEGYGYFKGVSTWERDALSDMLPNAHKSYIKLLASFCTAVPQLGMRLWSPRRAFFGRGMFNSALMSMTGAGLFMLPTDNLSTGANAAIGIASGLLLGAGTAQVFQYNQKLVGSAVKAAYGEEMVPTAIVVHSGGNFGMALPIIPALVAGQRKKDLGEGEVEAVKNTTWIPLAGYGVGIGLIALAEHGLAPHLNVLTRPFAKGLGYTVRYALPVMGGAALLTTDTHPQTNLPQPIPSLQSDEVTAPSLAPADLNLNTQPFLKVNETPTFKTGSRYTFGPKADFQLQPAE